MDKYKNKLVLVGLSIISLALYVAVAYFLERHQSSQLITLFSGLFACYLLLYHFVDGKNQVNKFILLGISLRLVLLFAFPNLSDDIFRFVWDGRLMNHGIHPFSNLPSYYIESGVAIDGIDKQLFDQLNSPNYFTIYPPIAQFVFWLSVVISPNSVFGSAIVIRLLIIAAEVASILLIRNLLRRFSINEKNVLIYALNPLVILELTGNLHFEAFMLLFTLLAIYWILKSKYLMSSIAMALAIASKLVPLIFLPFLFRRMHLKKLVIYYLLTALFTVALFIPILNKELVEGMSSSISLYFQKFEFNASIYYLVREIGFWIKGYNIIQTAGKYLALITFLTITLYALVSKSELKKIPEGFMWALVVYFSMATIVHPWYITTIIAFSVFTHYRFPVLWSFLIFFTYLGYTEEGFNEKLWVNILEYGGILAFMIYEFYKLRKTKLNKTPYLNE